AFVHDGGLLITTMDTANLAVANGLTPGVTIAAARSLKIIGSVVRAKVVDAASPIAYGYGDDLSIWTNNGPIFNLTNVVGARRRRNRPASSRRRRVIREGPRRPLLQQSNLAR